MTNPIIRLREALPPFPTADAAMLLQLAGAWQRSKAGTVAGNAANAFSIALGQVLETYAEAAIRSLLSTNDELRSKLEAAEKACAQIVNLIECVENRCMAADGPVTLTSDEITEDDLRRIYKAALLGATNTKGTR